MESLLAELYSGLTFITRLGSSPGRCPGSRGQCGLAAWWHFDALESTSARTGDYCWQHLLAQLRADPLEEARLQRHLDKILEAAVRADGPDDGS